MRAPRPDKSKIPTAGPLRKPDVEGPAHSNDEGRRLSGNRQGGQGRGRQEQDAVTPEGHRPRIEENLE